MSTVGVFFFFLVCQRLVVPVRRTARLHCERRERECAMRKREVRCVCCGVSDDILNFDGGIFLTLNRLQSWLDLSSTEV